MSLNWIIALWTVLTCLVSSAALAQSSGGFIQGQLLTAAELNAALAAKADFPTSYPTVQQLGAKCDGMTDDTVILNTVFNAAANGVVNFAPTSTGCLITGTINYTQQAPITVIMPGNCSASIKMVTPTASTALYFNIPVQAAPVYLWNLCFQTPTGTGAGGNGNYGIRINNANASYMHGLTFAHGFYDDIYIQSSFTTTIDTSMFGDTSAGSVNAAIVYAADKSANNSQVLTSHFDNNGTIDGVPAIIVNGSALNPTYGFNVSYNDFEGNWADLLFNYSNDVMLNGNYFDNVWCTTFPACTSGSTYPGYHFYCNSSCNQWTIFANWFGQAATTNFDNFTGINFDKNTLYNFTMSVAATALSGISCPTNQFLGTGSIFGACPNGLVFGAALTIATLPSCVAALIGYRAHVSNGVSAPALGSAVSTAGSTDVSVTCTAGGWVYG